MKLLTQPLKAFTLLRAWPNNRLTEVMHKSPVYRALALLHHDTAYSRLVRPPSLEGPPGDVDEPEVRYNLAEPFATD